jgi:hypothetical protein
VSCPVTILLCVLENTFLKENIVRTRFQITFLFVATLIAAFFFIATHAGTAEAGGNRNFRTHLTGAEEVPPADTRAQGQAIFQVSRDGTEIRFKVKLANIQNVRMAHIHLAPAGENGPIVVWLRPSGPPPEPIPGRFSGVYAEGTITEANLVGLLAGASLQDLIDEMRAGNTYVNVHTDQYPGGEVRGQIR